MLSFLSANLATIVGSAVVFGILLLIFIKKVKDRRKHKGGCGCGCGHCASSEFCHPK